MKHQENINGTIYNLSFKNGKLFRGWNLIVTDDGHEYLMRRNLSLSFKHAYQLYQSTIHLNEYIYTLDSYQKDKKSASLGAGAIFVAVLSGPVIRSLTPLSLWLGSSNLPVNWLISIKNIVETLAVILLFFIIIAIYRMWRLKSIIQGKGGQLHYIGKVQNLDPIKYTPHRKGIW